MIIKDLIDEDFSNYKEISMVISFPKCTFKCERDGCAQCQNKEMFKMKDIEISPSKIIKRYLKNKYSKAIVCSGLEPMDSFNDVYDLLNEFRSVCDDMFIIYTGYNFSEIEDKVHKLAEFGNVIIKFGRMMNNYVDNHYDKYLGVNLASTNQYSMYYPKNKKNGD